VDVALLDLRMQGMHGIEVAERLKALDPDVQIIILTAYESVETARQAIRLGACDYLSKPFDLDLVRVAVTDASNRREQLRRLRSLEEEIQQQKLQGEIARTKNEIYASILHDINGPLSFISGVTEMLYHDFPEISDLELANLDFIKEQLAHVSRQANRCIELSRRYLSYMSSSAAGQVCIDLSQVFTDVEKLLKFYPVAWDNELLVHLPEEEMLLRANGIDVIQILLNLTVNALQATAQPHTVDISARRLERPVTPEELRAGPTSLMVNPEGFVNQPPLAAIIVRDDGPGIPPEVLPRIFEPFFTTKAPKEGTGLGLSIVQRCVRQNKGALRLNSEPGVGTTVTVYLGLGRPPVE
jgi:signal transduction histidine kinase